MKLSDLLVFIIAFPLLLTQVHGASSVVLQEDFETNGSLGKFTSVSVASNFAWRWQVRDDNGGYAEMNGFGADGPSDDWLILTQPLDLGDVGNPNVTFEYIAQWTGPNAELVVSTDYDPEVHSDPGDATWASLPFYTDGTDSEPSESGSWTPITSDLVDLSAYKTDNVYLGFHYVSTGTVSGEARTWRILDLVVGDSDPDATLLLSALEDIEPWTAVNAVGSEEWTAFLLGDRESVAFDGAFSPDTNEDWLISPSITVADSDIPVINFEYYNEASGPHIELLVSNNYDAATHTDPNAATWLTLPVDYSVATSERWTSFSGNSFFGVAGDSVHVAFKYTSVGGEAPQGRLVGISNFCVFKAAEAPALTADFSALPIQPTTAQTVDFEAQASGGKQPYTFAWDFGDGSTSEMENPSYQYTNAGIYTVTLAVTDALGGQDVFVQSDYINAVNEANVLVKTDFEGADDDPIPGPWQTFSIASDAEWLLDTEASRSAAVITGFSSNEASEDWLLSPKLPLVGSLFPVLTVDVFTRFSGPLLDVLVSADYDGGDPTGATWDSLNVDFSDFPAQAWTEVGALSLAGLDGDHTVAFKYVSTGVGSGDGRTYGIDNVRVINEDELPLLSSLSVSGSSDEVTIVDTVVFQPFITGGKHPYSYAWDFGDGTSSSNGLPSHVFAAAGSYSVSLSVTDATGASREAVLPSPINVIDVDDILFDYDFVGFDGDDPVDDWTAVSEASFEDWNLDTIDGQQGIFMNGFGSDEASDDWLISPVFQIGQGEQGTLSFDLNRFFSGGSFEVLASTGYDPLSEDPTTVVWVPIPGDFTFDDWSRPSGLTIPISGDVRLAFHYTSDGTGPGDGQRIGVDQIRVVKLTAPPVSDSFLDTDFEGEVDVPIGAPWTTVSVASDAVWEMQEWNGRHGAFMNGFGADVASEDWLISPPMDLSGDEIPLLSFSHFVRFSGPEIQVLISTDFNSDPSAANWTDLQLDFSMLPEREWIDFEKINLASFNGAATHLAFKYVSNGTEGGDGRLAGIDSVVVAKSDTAPVLTVDLDSPSVGTTGNALAFAASASGGTLPYTFAWDFGDGAVGEGTETTHVYNEAGTFTVTITVTDGAETTSMMSDEVTVTFAGDTLLEGVFGGNNDTPITAPWTAVSVASDRDWQIDTTGGAQGAVANGFGADAPSDDWLISPPFDINVWAQTSLGFDYYQNFSGPEIEVLLGAEFQDGNDPTAVHWSRVSADLGAVANSEWTRQSGIDISAFAGRQCRLAFRYTTVGTAAGEGKLIGINHVRVSTIIPDIPAPETYTFDEWKATNGYFKSGDPSGAVDADADADGFANGHEFRFDLNPRSGAGYGNLPQISILADGTYRVTYRRISDVEAWTVQLSDDLENWVDAEEGQDIETMIQKDGGLGEVLETVRVDLKRARHYVRVVLP
jgi:PKD repeat protein